MFKINKYLHVLILSLFITACSDSPDDDSISENNPEIATIAFFNALYNEKDIKKAASVCSPKIAKLIMHYRTPQAVARHMFNMSYDKVEIKPDDTGVKIREQFKGTARITVYFNGYYNGNRLQDVKRLALVQEGNKWVIDKILKDPF